MDNQNFQIIDLIDLSSKYSQWIAIQKFQDYDVYEYTQLKYRSYLVKLIINQQHGTQL